MVVTVATQVVVAEDSPAFIHPSKPVGSTMDEVTACGHAARNGWAIAKMHDHVWQRVVPSPEPIEIVELDAIRRLVNDGYVVIAVGGGGIPVVRDQSGNLRGVDAVIDKDLASGLLAQQISAPLFIISTAMRKVCLNFGKPGQRELDSMTLAEAKRYLEDGHFGAGTMRPKIQAIVKFLEGGGRKAIITCPADLEGALAGTAGTTIVAA
jgi:carbamate kinase